jgi:hypothetical protein
MLGRGGQNTNSISYINSYAKSITTDFSGSDYTDLSYPPYADTASGINLDNENTTFALFKYNGENLKTSDFRETGSFTFHVKYATRYSSNRIFNFRYPNVISLSQIGSSLTAKFFSSLNPGTVIPYVITGCINSDLNIASLNESFASPYNTITYTIASGIGSTIITFNVSGGLSTSISLQA